MDINRRAAASLFLAFMTTTIIISVSNNAAAAIYDSRSTGIDGYAVAAASPSQENVSGYIIQLRGEPLIKELLLLDREIAALEDKKAKIASEQPYAGVPVVGPFFSALSTSSTNYKLTSKMVEREGIKNEFLQEHRNALRNIMNIVDNPRAGAAVLRPSLHLAGPNPMTGFLLSEPETLQNADQGAGRITVKREYYYAFNGFAVNMTSADAERIGQSEYVENVYPDTVATIQLSDSVPLIGASDVWQLDANGNNCAQSGQPCINGTGVKIAVLDTGIDYTHSDLGGCFGSGCKVAGGYDLVNDDANPMDDHGHGTHVAATAAGNGSLNGVAPGATLLAFKICDNGGSCYTSDIIAGIEMAASDGADVISLSVGGSGNPDDVMSTAVDNAVDAGMVAVIAAGNSGPNAMTINSPGTARKAITVGASENDIGRSSILNVSGSIISSQGLLKSAAGEVTVELKNVSGYGTADDFAQSGDFSGKIALIQRGSITFGEKVSNAYSAGAVGAVIYNNAAGGFLGVLTNGSMIPAASIAMENGTALLDLINQGTVTATLSVSDDYNFTRQITSFSSRGPTSLYTMKPDVVAPGDYICAAEWDGAWSSNRCLDSSHVAISGTSMATPHVSGVVALVKQAHPDWTPDEIKAALRSTATNLGYNHTEQGYGLVNASAAVALSNPCVAEINTSQGSGFPYINGIATITGIASCKWGLREWALEYSDVFEQTDWSVLNSSSTPVLSGALVTFDTSTIPVGWHSLRLRMTSLDSVVYYDNVLFNSMTQCNNSVDDDGDHLTDNQDPGCFENITNSSTYNPIFNNESRATDECRDETDNDGDGLNGFADPGCSLGYHMSESQATSECQDGIDNDNDTFVDFPYDLGCATPQQNIEMGTECEDNRDNDRDGLIDESDPGCWENASDQSTYNPSLNDESAATSQCQDGIDNDGDGATDTGDSSCLMPWGADESMHMQVAYTEICTFEELNGAISNSRINGNYSLICDLDMAGRNWTYPNLNGVLNGNGHTISNLKSESASSASLFNNVNGLVKNLNVVGLNISAKRFASGIAIRMTGAIVNVSVAGNITLIGDYPDYLNEVHGGAGGLAVYVYGDIINSSFRGNIMSIDNKSSFAVGGLVAGGSTVANVPDSSFVVRGSYAKANISGSSLISGGIAGLAGNAQIYDTVAESILRSYSYAGGAIGLSMWGDIIIENSSFSSDMASYYPSVGGERFGGVIGTDDSNSAVIRGVSVRTNISGRDLLGGLIGESSKYPVNLYELEIYNSSSFVNISGNGFRVGGLVGRLYVWHNIDRSVENAMLTMKATPALIKSSSVSGELVGKFVGGLVGYFESFAYTANADTENRYAPMTGMLIKDSYFSGIIRNAPGCSGCSSGGLVGYMFSRGIIEKSYSQGTFYDDYPTGGLVGISRFGTSISNSYSKANIINSGSGLVSIQYGWLSYPGYYNYSMRLTKSFSTGKSASGLVGTQILDFIYVTDSYWDTESSGTNTSAAGVGRTTTEMKDISTYQGWDFDNIWYMPPDGYPMLRWQLGMPCTPNILNTTPTEWINISRCYENGSRIQQRRVTQYDANGCVENQTLYEYRKASEICWACFPLITNTTWGSWTNATACSNGNLTQSRNMTVYDANACGTGNTTLFDYRNASCVLCGNGMIDAGEECDGSNITATCQSLGYAGGSLACHDNCTHNTTSCTTTPSQPPSGGGGGGGGGAPATKPKTTTPAQPPEQTPPETPQQPSGQSDMQRTYVVDNQRLAEGYSQALSVDDTVKFDATGEGTMHQLTVKEVTNDSATMIIQSEPVEFTLRKGEARAFDFDNDTHSEILVILDDIINGRAMIKIAYIAAAAPGQPLAGGIMLIAVAAVVIIAAGIALVAVAYIVSRKGPRGVGHLPSAGKSGKSDGSRTKIKGMISEGCRMIDAGEFASATRVYGRIKSEYESSGISDKRLYGEIMEFYGELTEATKGKE